MHPFLRDRRLLKGYLAAWLPMAILVGTVIGASSKLRLSEVISLTVPICLILGAVCLSAWYVCRWLELKTTAHWKLVLFFAVSAMCASSVVMMVVKALVSLFNNSDAGLPERLSSAVPVMAVVFGLIYLLSIVLHYLILATESSRRAEVLSREAELKALKAQVNPHFLFNSLNSISALTTIDPSKARQMCIALSDFLRCSLKLGESLSVPLSEELALAKSYLDVEKIRFGSKLRVTQDLAPFCDRCEVPPLLVQPLVENAIKHGIATLDHGGEVVVCGARYDNILRVTIENPFDPDAPPAVRNGFGLASVRNRLQARYGSAGKIEIEVNHDHYRVVLSLPWSQVESVAQ